MSSLSDNLRSIVDRWVIEAGRYVGNRMKTKGFLSTQGEESREAEVWLAQQAAYDLWQARQAAKASKALSGVKALKLQPA